MLTDNSTSFQQPADIGVNLSISCHTYARELYYVYCVPQST